MTEATHLRTIKQLSEELKPTGGFSAASLRWLVFNAETNGLRQALVRVGRKVYIDRQRFDAWLDAQRTDQRAA